MGSKTTNQTANSQTSSTVTPNNPAWVTQSLQGLNARIGQLGNVDPSSYVAPASTLQSQAFGGAANLSDGSAGYGAATGLVGQGTGGANLNSGGASLLDNGGLAKYMNPYLQTVLGASDAAADQSDAQTMGALKAQAAGSGAFGDSTFGIAQGTTAGQLALARQQTRAGLLSDAYKTALSADQFDTGNRQQSDLANQASANDASNRSLSGAGLLAGITSSAGAQQRANVATQDAEGGVQRGIDQSKATAPISLAEALASLYGSNQLGLLQGSTSTGTASGSSTTNVSDPMASVGGLLGGVGSAITGLQKVGGVAGLAGLFASDVRLKRNLKPIAPDSRGRRRFSWTYVWGQHGEGYLAQDLLKTDPHAVGQWFGGFYGVDHSKLEGAQWAS